ncbi:MAG: L-threonylcarbamoyladenylate synthase, partial [Verrucomicrobia bacterium]|nr:L-threonylcarbamoyladenylate synthase [Verrucomicrobiota bacterium]
MKTRVLPVSRESIKEACEILRRGDVVAFPTETVYGLGGLGLETAAIQKIFEAKGRPTTDPLILHLPSPDLQEAISAGWVTEPVPTFAFALTKHFWPGPLTLVLKRGRLVPYPLTAGLETVAVRCPAHPAARQLLSSLGAPLAAPSANRFGHISPTDAPAVLQELNGKIPLILDGGPCPAGIESTVVSLIDDPPVILRPGVISAESISESLGIKCEISTSLSQKNTPSTSPGMLASHYAPQSPLYLCREPIRHFDPKYQFILFGPREGSSASNVHSLSPDHRPETVARNLYRTLRKVDSLRPT